MGDLKSPLLSKELYKAKADGLVDNTFDGSWSSLTDAGEATNLNLCHMAGTELLLDDCACCVVVHAVYGSVVWYGCAV